MKKFFSPFVLILTALIFSVYYYAKIRMANTSLESLMLAIPFLLIWLTPIIYWIGNRDSENKIDHWVHLLSYLSMGFVNFLIIFLLATDALLLITDLSQQLIVHDFILRHDGKIVLTFSILALLIGHSNAKFGPNLKKIQIKFPNLHPDLVGFKIIQISDLHIGPTLKKDYVQKVVNQTIALKPDAIVLTGDIVDGPLEKLKVDASPLIELGKMGAYFSLGNHDYYSGYQEWLNFFRESGFITLINSHDIITKGHARLMMAGVTDPAAKIFQHEGPSPEKAIKNSIHSKNDNADFKILLAHNPKVASLASAVGFHLQLSGHTHAGQFFPWTLVVKLVHSPHYWGLSKENEMQVYVSAGTGTWGPPIRFGSEPELTLIELTS
ncbi:MAG: metallophosphoesterase [Bacteriovoracaceae bacterium]